MKILIFYQYFGTPKGGWSTRIYEMSRRWVEAGHEVSVVTSLYDKSDLTASGFYEKQRHAGIDVYVINIKLSNKHHTLYRIYSFFFYAFMASFLGLRAPCDVVLASSGPITVGIPALLTKWLRRKPMVFEVRDLWPDGAVAFGILSNPLLKKLAYWFEALCYRQSRLVVTASEGMTRNIAQRFPSTSLFTIPNASDVDLFRTPVDNRDIYKCYAGKKVFVYTGTLGLIDGCRQIVEAAIELQKRGREDIIILLIGDGKERSELEQLATEYLLKNIEFIGLMPKEKLVGYIQVARASLLTVKPIPFMDNCSPNKIFDAFAAGVPIIQTTQGWIKDLVEETGCGLNVPPNDVVAFADAIIQLCDKELLFESCCRVSAKLGDSTFNRDKLAKKMLTAIFSSQEKE